MAKAHISGADQVLEWYDRNITGTFYSVWMGKQLLFSYSSEDENGRDKLANDLAAFEQNNIADVMTIKLHPELDKSGFITDKTPVYASLNFRCIDIEKLQPINRAQVMGTEQRYSPTVTAMLQESMEVNKKLLAYLEQEEEEEDEDEQGFLAGILSNPEYKPLIMGVLHKFLAPQQPAPMQPAGMAGTIGQNEINYLQILMGKGVTTQHLAKLAAMETEKLQSLLLML